MDYKELADNRLKLNCQFIPLSNRGMWLELRKQGIGGSDVAGILNVSPFTNKLKVWESKQEGYEPEELNNSAVDFGNNMEDLIFRMFSYKYGNIYATLSYKDVLFRNWFIPYFQASVDGILVERKTNKVGVLEIKTVQPSAIHNWYDEAGNPITPLYYLLQVYHYLNTLGLDFIVVYVLANTENGDTSMRFLQPRRYDREDIIDELNNVNYVCNTFWNDNVIGNKKPGIKI